MWPMRRRPAATSAPPSTAFRSRRARGNAQGVESNRIIVGAYTDRKGGVCPMLAAHRHGGTSLASFAHAGTATPARGARPASDRELHTLRAMLEASIALDELPALEEVARGQKLRAPRLFRRFDE